MNRPTVFLWRGRLGKFGVAGILCDAPRPGRRKAILAKVANCQAALGLTHTQFHDGISGIKMANFGTSPKLASISS